MLTDQTTRRQVLRSHVHRAHEELDTLIGALETSRDYRRYLRGMAAFRLAAESATDAAFFPSWLQGWRPVSTRVALEKDLATLKLPPLSMSAIAPPDTESALLGMLYTLEGSALGARLIAKRAALLGFTEAYGASHLAVQTGTPGNWRAFLDLLEDAPVFEAEEAGRAASSLFGFAYNAMILVDRAGDEVHG